jgi:hypothetical protein
MSIEEIQAHIARLGITEQDIADAVQWARENPGCSGVDGRVAPLVTSGQVATAPDAHVAVMQPAADVPEIRPLSESFRILKERGSSVTLDGQFSHDLEDIVNHYGEPLNPPAWD